MATLNSSVCLGMIVRDEEAHIERCISSTLPLVDEYCIVDTGCQDKTIELAADLLKGIPGRVLQSAWEGHAHNRSELLEWSREGSADYTLMMDADTELVIERPLRELTADEYMIPIHDRSLVYPLPLLTSTRKRFVYKGVAHAYLACEDGPTDGVVLDELKLIDHGGGGRRPGKLEHDRDLLAAEVGKNPADARSWFYLAQSYRDLDQIPEAIAAYKVRIGLGGWSEEVYQALYQCGMLLSAHVNFYEGGKLLMMAAEMKQNRAEALRALSGCAEAVANKIVYPKDEVLFVEPGAYTAKPPSSMPEFPDIKPNPARKRPPRKPLVADDVSAIVVTRGNVDLDPVIDHLPFKDILVWDNSQAAVDYKLFGRFCAIPLAKNPVLFWVDDDVIFTAFDELLAAYEPGVLVANMDQPWVDGCGYGDDIVLVGAGSLCDAALPAQAFVRYLEQHPFDEDILLGCDFVLSLLPHKRVDVGYDTLPYTDDLDRLYQQPETPARKARMMNRIRAMKAAE